MNNFNTSVDCEQRVKGLVHETTVNCGGLMIADLGDHEYCNHESDWSLMQVSYAT